MGKVILNNWLTRRIAHGLYHIKRIRLLGNWSLQKKLAVCFVLIAAVPLLLSAVIQYVYMTNYLPEKENRQLYATVVQCEKNIQYELDGFMQRIDLLAYNAGLENYLSLPYGASEAEVSMRINQIWSTLNNYYFNADDSSYSRLYVNWNTPYGYLFNDDSIVPMSQFYQNPLYVDVDVSSGKTVWIRRHTSRNGLSVISAVKPILDLQNQNLLGVMELEFDSAILSQIVRDIGYENLGSVLFVDQQGDVIVRNDQTETPVYTPEYILSVLQTMEQEGIGTTILDGQMVTRVVNQATGWTLLTLTPVSHTYHDVYILSGVMLLITGVFILLASVLSLPISHSISMPIRRLIAAVNRVEEDNFTTKLPVDSEDELGQLSMSFNEMNRRLHYLVEAVYKTEIEKKNAELSLLQSQINPHFLYNTLDTMNWMALSEGNREVAKMARSLADFFRHSLSGGQTVISVAEELKLVENYLDIQKIRLDGKLKVLIDVPDNLLARRTLKLILQPVVENSVLHGYGDNGGIAVLTVRISVREEGEDLLFTVADDGVGIPPDRMATLLSGDGGKAYGIRNVNRRITMFYGPQYGLSYHPVEPHGTLAIIRIGLEADDGQERKKEAENAD